MLLCNEEHAKIDLFLTKCNGSTTICYRSVKEALVVSQKASISRSRCGLQDSSCLSRVSLYLTIQVQIPLQINIHHIPLGSFMMATKAKEVKLEMISEDDKIIAYVVYLTEHPDILRSTALA